MIIEVGKKEPAYKWKWDRIWKKWELVYTSPKGKEFGFSSYVLEIPENVKMQELAHFTIQTYLAQIDQIFVWTERKNFWGNFVDGEYVPISTVWNK